MNGVVKVRATPDTQVMLVEYVIHRMLPMVVIIGSVSIPNASDGTKSIPTMTIGFILRAVFDIHAPSQVV